jgi:hypothetical protein
MRLWGPSTGPTTRHQPSSSGPRLPEGPRPQNQNEQNPPRLAPRKPRPSPLTPLPWRPPRLSLARTLHPRAQRPSPVFLPGASWRLRVIDNLKKTVDTMARAACARSSKDSVFTETVREQVKEVGKTAEMIYDQMEWVDKPTPTASQA